MRIREMVPGDYANVYTLWISTPGMGLNDRDDSPDGIARYLARNPHTSFVAQEGGHIVGAILCGHDGRRGFIYHLVVAAQQRKKGIGRNLVDAALSALKEEGIHKVALVVFAENSAGNAFWERLGFTRRTDLNYRNKALAELERMDIH